MSRDLGGERVVPRDPWVQFGPLLELDYLVRHRSVYVGFRPVLEILNTDPLISDSDRNLGDKNQDFTIEYTVDDADSGDVLDGDGVD